MTVYSGQYQVENFSYDLQEFLKNNKNLAGRPIPLGIKKGSGIYGRKVFKPDKKWGIIEEGKVYLSTNDANNPYLITRVKVIPRTFSAKKPVEKIAWSALRVNRDNDSFNTIGTKDAKDPTSVMEMSSGFWNPTAEFWLSTEPVFIGKLYSPSIGFMNWNTDPLP